MKKIITILLMCALFLPVYAVAEPEEFETQTSQEQEMVAPGETEEISSDSIKTEGENLMPVQTPSESGFKMPSSKKQLALKFAVAMLCVAGCSLFLYLSLSVYNRLRDGFLAEDNPLPEGEEPLDAPQDLTEAVKTFVDKTHWHGV